MQAFGLINLLRFRFGLGPIHHIFGRISRHLKVDVAALLVRDGATAVDVDNERSLRATEAIMEKRRPPQRPDAKLLLGLDHAGRLDHRLADAGLVG